MLTWLILVVGAYLLGSIPFGLLIGLARGVDIRTAGSGNVGATNVGRLLGRPVGVLCFVLDAAKGAVPVTLAGVLTNIWGLPATTRVGAATVAPVHLWMWLAVAAAALLGHICSPWLGFKGGKGVATGFGAMLALWPHLTIPAVVALVLWLMVVMVTRYVSLASILAAASLPLVALIGALVSGPPAGEAVRAHLPIILMTAALAALVITRHRANIGRLRSGTESRVGERGPTR